jgi:hypothetical protein
VCNKMIKEVNANLVICISSIAYIDNCLWVKIGIKLVIHLLFPIDDNIKRDCCDGTYKNAI